MEAAILFPDFRVRQVAEFFLQHELLGMVVGVLGFLEQSPWGEEGFEDRLVHVARTDDDGRDAVQGSVEVVESDIGFLERGILHEFVGDFLEVVVEFKDMVGIPTDRTGDVEGKARGIKQKGRDLIRDDFGRMEVAGVEEAEDVVLQGVAHVELMGSDRVGFHPDSEDLGFHGYVRVLAVEGDGEDFVEGFFEPFAGAAAGGGNFFKAIGDPDVARGFLAEGFAELPGDLDGVLAMLHPIRANFGVGGREGQSFFDHRRRETGRVIV